MTQQPSTDILMRWIIDEIRVARGSRPYLTHASAVNYRDTTALNYLIKSIVPSREYTRLTETVCVPLGVFFTFATILYVPSWSALSKVMADTLKSLE